jgi:spore coat polysaccharide biosynthesis protein SpsF
MTKTALSLGTDQEHFWAGDFGNAYIERNDNKTLLRSNTNLFSKVFARTGPLDSIIEFGPNIGLNLAAIHDLSPTTELHAVEINELACHSLKQRPGVVSVKNASILAYEADLQYDMAMAKGLLIHIHPDHLPRAYESLYQASRRFVFVCEYYNPSPVAIPYRGHDDRLFKRDFAGDMLDRYADLTLVDYGFYYRRDPIFPQDDISWFLMEKRG